MTKSLTLFQRMSYSGINIYVEYLIGMASSVLIARSMLPADYGSYTYFLWMITLATSLVNAGISTGVIRFVAEARGQKEYGKINAIDKYLRHIQLFKIAVLLMVVLGIYLWKNDVYLPKDLAPLLLFLPVVLYCKILHMYRISVLKGLESFKELALVPVIVSPINFLVVLVLYLSHVGLEVFLLAYFSITVLYWWVTQYLVKNVTKSLGVVELENEYKDRIKRHLKISGLSAVLSFLVMSQSEIAFLKWFGYADAVAYFSIAHQLSGAAMLLVPGIYSNILLPIIARSVAENYESSAIKIKLSMVYLFQMGLLVAVPLLLFSPILIETLYGEKYQMVSGVLMWLISFSVLKCINGTATAYLMSVDQQSLILKVTAVFVFVTLFLDALLIWKFGLNGAIAAYGLSAVSMVTVLNILAFRLLKQKPLWKQINLTAIAALVAGVFTMLGALLLHMALPDLFVMIFGSFIFVIFYFPLLCWFGAIRHDEMHLLETFLSKQGSFGGLFLPYLRYCMAKQGGV